MGCFTPLECIVKTLTAVTAFGCHSSLSSFKHLVYFAADSTTNAVMSNVRLCVNAAVRGFLVVIVVRGEGGPVPALLYASTATWYRVLGRSPDTLAVVSSPAVLTRSAAASLSCCRQYRI